MRSELCSDASENLSTVAGAEQGAKQQKPAAAPKFPCEGLRCTDDSDCGTKCKCDNPSKKLAAGKCVVRSGAASSKAPKKK
jgi:hypothetical protein